MNKPVLLVATAVFCVGLSPMAIAGDNTFWGTGIGAAMGGLLGSQFGRGSGQLAATGAGVFLGGMMGNSVGHSLDRADSAYARSYYAPRSYYPPSYESYEPTYVAPPPPASVVYVQPPPDVIEYRPVQSVYIEEGFVGAPPPPRRHRRGHCREFTQTIRIDGRAYESYGTACLRPDGSWQIEK